MGLLISVLRNAELGDCTKDGISSRYKTLCVVNASGPFKPENHIDASPPVIVERHQPGCLRIVPAYWNSSKERWDIVPLHTSMGGNYGATSDSRFTELCERLLGHRFYGAVAIHDRIE